MSELYARYKYIGMSEMYALEIYMHVRNICILETYMHVRNICMYFQKHKTTKSGLQIFLVCVVWRYCIKIS